MIHTCIPSDFPSIFHGMDMRLFISTFLLIFLAELGDKTQLTAMARAAGSEGGKWTVFLAATAALVLSTLLAVTLGRAIARFIPDYMVRILAAAMFIAFGIFLLLGALREKPEAQMLDTETPATSGMMMRAILHIAADFEAASAADYAALAEQATDTATRKLFLDLEEDERKHLQMMRHAEKDHAHIKVEKIQRTELPSSPELEHDVARSDRPGLQHALEHEEATMQFYQELAGRTAIPTLRRTFIYLADAEREHIARIKSLTS